MIHVSFIGMGLIGGSIARCFKKEYGEEIFIKAFDENTSRTQLAQSLGIIDHGCSSIEEVLLNADVLILCTPVQTLCALLKEVMLSPHLKKGAIITDVGSTKEEIVRLGNTFAMQSKGVFIGGHPMAGSHKSGVEAANERLFENAFYVLTPPPGVDGQLHFLKKLLASTKANVIEMSPVEHDQVVGAISHFPHLIASSLVAQIGHYNSENEWYLRLAAGGFRDVTRIASSHPSMWRDIILSNRKYLIAHMKDWQERMAGLLDMIEVADPEQIRDFFAHAKHVRDSLPDNQRGAIPSFYDLYIDVPDHPGVIGQITTLLGEHRISITNIAILEQREDIMGALRLTFRHKEDMEEASKLIEQANYAVYRRD